LVGREHEPVFSGGGRPSRGGDDLEYGHRVFGIDGREGRLL
jgi:hypothetical protein